jgi:hypothetical protein
MPLIVAYDISDDALLRIYWEEFKPGIPAFNSAFDADEIPTRTTSGSTTGAQILLQATLHPSMITKDLDGSIVMTVRVRHEEGNGRV